jgi:hypothetical protein
MASMRQLGQNLLLTKDDGVTITRCIKDKDEREKIKKDFNEKGMPGIAGIFEPLKQEKIEDKIKEPIKQDKPVEKKSTTSGNYKGSER